MSNDDQKSAAAEPGARDDMVNSADLTVALENLRREVEERKIAEEKLRREVEERAAVEQELRGMLNIIRQQEEAIRAMATPILRVWDGVLTMPVIGRLDSIRATHMMESLLHEITKTRARHTILDLTGVDDLDATAANHLLNLIRAAGLLGTRCLVSGISPKMAQTIISLGLSLTQLESFSTLEEALRHALDESARGRSAKREARARF